MTFSAKSAANIQIAEYCRDNGIAECVGVSRAYYAAFQSAKEYLLSKGFTDSNYDMKAAQLGLSQFELGKQEFAHSNIWSVVQKCLIGEGKQVEGMKAPALGRKLLKERKAADYTTRQHVNSELVTIIDNAKLVISLVK